MSSKLGKRILIIDDNENIHIDFRKVLTSHTSNPKMDEIELFLFSQEKEKGVVLNHTYEIDHAHFGEQGVDMIKKANEENNPYSLVFLDIRMPPGQDGVTTAQQIFEFDKEIQIVFCTAYSDYSLEEITSKLKNCDRFLFLKKPFEPSEVIQIANCLSHKWLINHHLLHNLHQYKKLLKSQKTKTTKKSSAKKKAAKKVVKPRLNKKKKKK